MVTGDLEDILAAARRDRQAGNREAAERGYISAAEFARTGDFQLERAHALRHVSDLARERGSVADAAAAASQAVAIYRSRPDPNALHLANALRLHALALSDAGADRDALPLWEEAHGLYRTMGVLAGVQEAERQLRRLGRAI